MSLVSRSSVFRSVQIFRSPPRRFQQRRGLITVKIGDSPGGIRLLVISGFVEGAVATAIGGYAFYHWSGLKNAVDAIKHPVQFLRQYKSLPQSVEVDQDVKGQPNTTTQILTALRFLAKAYVAPIPGSGVLVDLAFDGVEKIVDTHKEEARAILKSALQEVQEAAKTRGEGSKAVAWDVLAILRNRLGQIQALASAVGQDKIGLIFESIPGFHEHASCHVSGARDSILPVYQKGLAKGKSILSDLSRSLNFTPAAGAGSSLVEPAKPDPQAQVRTEESSEIIQDK